MRAPPGIHLGPLAVALILGACRIVLPVPNPKPTLIRSDSTYTFTLECGHDADGTSADVTVYGSSPTKIAKELHPLTCHESQDVTGFESFNFVIYLHRDWTAISGCPTGATDSTGSFSCEYPGPTHYYLRQREPGRVTWASLTVTPK